MMMRWSVLYVLLTTVKSQYPVLLIAKLPKNLYNLKCILNADDYSRNASIWTTNTNNSNVIRKYPLDQIGPLNCNFENDHCNFNVIGFHDEDFHVIDDKTIVRYKTPPFMTHSNDKFQQADIITQHIGDEISFSIQIIDPNFHDIHIALCNEYEISYFSKCYWFIFHQSSNQNVTTTLWRCENIVLYDDYSYPSDRCKEENQTHNNFKEKGWNSFTIKLNKITEQLEISLTNENQILISYMDSKPINVQNIFCKSNKTVEWKFYKAKFIFTTKENNRVISSQIKSPQNNICISLSTMMCTFCQIKISVRYLKSNSIERVHTLTPEKTSDGWHQQKIPITFTGDYSEGIELYFETSSLHNYNVRKSSTFWAIDEISECHFKDLIVLEKNITIYDINNIKVACQVNGNEEKYKVIPNRPYMCPAGYFGENCMLPCNNVNRNDLCNMTVICSDSECFCPSGFYDWSCSSVCTDRIQVELCLSVCSKECVKCNYFSKTCKKCNVGLKLPHCNETSSAIWHILPKVEYIDYDYINVSLDIDESSITKDELEEFKYYSIQYRENADNGLDWTSFDGLKFDIFPESVTKIGSSPGIMYQLRILLYDDKFHYYSNNDIPYINISTKCDDWNILNIKQDDNPDEIVLNIIISQSERMCHNESYFLFINDNEFNIIAINKKKDNYKVSLSRLNQHGNMLVSLKRRDNNEIVNETYLKIEDRKSSEVLNLKPITMETEINLSWNIPEYPNGEIMYYNVTWQIKQYLGCRTEIKNGVIKSENAKETKYTIRGLQPYVKYYITITPVSSVEGKTVLLIANTSQTETSNETLTHTFKNIEKSKVILELQPFNCTQVQRKIDYSVDVIVNSPWAKDNKPLISMDCNISYICLINIYQLKPFTNYTAFINIGRPEQNNNFMYHFTTKPDVPHAVTEFISYGTTNTRVYLKWKKPYPPNGILEHYNLQYHCLESSCVRAYELLISPNPLCDAWEDYSCVTIQSNLYEGYTYIFFLNSKNKDVGLYSEDADTKAVPTYKNPSAPVNASAVFNNDNRTLIVKWKHPLFNNPIDIFICNLYKEEQNEFVEQKKYHLINNKYKMEYVLQVSTIFPLSHIS